MKKKQVNFSILDENFELQVVSENSKFLENSIAYLESSLNSLRKKHPNLTSTRCAIMLALDSCNELFKSQKKNALEHEKNDDVIIKDTNLQLNALNKKIDDFLAEQDQ